MKSDAGRVPTGLRWRLCRSTIGAVVWALAMLLPVTSADAGDLCLLAGVGVGTVRYPPRAMYGSLELVRPLALAPWGFWGAADLSGEDYFVGAGLFVTQKVSERWALGLSSGPGRFSSRKLDLGGSFQFRSSLYVAHQLRQGTSVLLSVGHISNAGTSRMNPGAESVRLLVAIPLGRLEGSARASEGR